MPKEYTLSTQTLKDIMNNIPPEKWDECMDEMKVALKQISATMIVVRETCKVMDVDPSDAISFPDEITWVDDGLNQNTMTFHDKETGENHGGIVLPLGNGEK